MVYSHEVENMCCVAKGPNHGPAPIPEEGKWVQAKEIKDISGLTHGIGRWFLPLVRRKRNGYFFPRRQVRLFPHWYWRKPNSFPKSYREDLRVLI